MRPHAAQVRARTRPQRSVGEGRGARAVGVRAHTPAPGGREKEGARAEGSSLLFWLDDGRSPLTAHRSPLTPPALSSPPASPPCTCVVCSLVQGAGDTQRDTGFLHVQVALCRSCCCCCCWSWPGRRGGGYSEHPRPVCVFPEPDVGCFYTISRTESAVAPMVLHVLNSSLAFSSDSKSAPTATASICAKSIPYGC